MLSPLLVLVGGHRVSEEDHPPGVIAHTSDFHEDFSKPHDMRKAYLEIWKSKFSQALTHTFVLFFPFGSHSFIIIVTGLLLPATSLVPFQKNCHLEHLFCWLEDNYNAHFKAQSNTTVCFVQQMFNGHYPNTSRPKPWTRDGHFHLIPTLVCPTSHSTPKPLRILPELISSPNLLDTNHPCPTFTYTCYELAWTLIKDRKNMSGKKQKE